MFRPNAAPVSMMKRPRNIETIGTFSPETSSYDDRCRWIRIYPIYLNKLRTRKQGRRVSSALAVENPTCTQIRDVLLHANMEILVEDNVSHPLQYSGTHPMSTADDAGRVLVHLFDSNHCSLSPEVIGSNKKDVFKYLCEMIPKLKSRTQKDVSSSSHRRKR